ncbi:MAG: hypothetical protein ACK524_08945 [Planctomyces sp.]
MRKLICFAMMACLGMVSQSQAGVLKLAGTTSSATGVFDNLNWSFDAVYTQNLAGAAAVITSGVLKLGTTTLNVNTGTAGDTITVTVDPGVNDDRLVIAFDYGNSGTILGGSVSGLTVQGKADVASAIASDANISLLAALGNSVSGPSSVTLFDTGLGVVTVTLDGSVPVPEPSSLGILACLGLVVGRGVYKRARAAA